MNMKMSNVQCQMYHETWPQKITEHTHFECKSCKRDKSCSSEDNNMIPSLVP